MLRHFVGGLDQELPDRSGVSDPNSKGGHRERCLLGSCRESSGNSLLTNDGPIRPLIGPPAETPGFSGISDVSGRTGGSFAARNEVSCVFAAQMASKSLF